MSKPPADKNPPTRKPPRRISKSYLENVALHYLERFATSSENLRRVLMRRVERSARFHQDDPALGAALVDELVERYLRSGLLNDQQYAEARVRSLHRRGASARAIRQTLTAKGVESDDAQNAIASLRDELGPDADLDEAAALAYARRRRIGPFRPPEKQAELRQKDAAALGRAGFSWDVVRRILDRTDDDGAD